MNIINIQKYAAFIAMPMRPAPTRRYGNAEHVPFAISRHIVIGVHERQRQERREKRVFGKTWKNWTATMRIARREISYMQTTVISANKLMPIANSSYATCITGNITSDISYIGVIQSRAIVGLSERYEHKCRPSKLFPSRCNDGKLFRSAEIATQVACAILKQIDYKKI